MTQRFGWPNEMFPYDAWKPENESRPADRSLDEVQRNPGIHHIKSRIPQAASRLRVDM